MAVLGPPSSLTCLSGSHCVLIPCVLLLLQAILPSDFPLVGNQRWFFNLPTLCSPRVDGEAFFQVLGNCQRCSDFKLWLPGGKDLNF